MGFLHVLCEDSIVFFTKIFIYYIFIICFKLVVWFFANGLSFLIISLVKLVVTNNKAVGSVCSFKVLL